MKFRNGLTVLMERFSFNVLKVLSYSVKSGKQFSQKRPCQYQSAVGETKSSELTIARYKKDLRSGIVEFVFSFDIVK